MSSQERNALLTAKAFAKTFIEEVNSELCLYSFHRRAEASKQLMAALEALEDA